MFNLLLLFLLLRCQAEISSALDTYFFGQKSEIAQSSINPGNQILNLPELQLELDARGEVKWREGRQLVVLRPRLIAKHEIIASATSSESRSETKVDLTDAFYERNWTDEISTTIGLQVFQWGPAEFINASNPFYHFNSQQRSLLYKEKGKVLLRLNYSGSKTESLIIAVEPVSNNEPEWIYEAKFAPKYALKFEKVLSQSADYVGLVAGSGERSVFFIGEYFSISPVEGFSLYGDAKHSLKEINYVPAFNGVGYDLVEATDSGVWPIFAVLGGRWEANYDIRLELIHNSAGFANEELKAAVSAGSNVLNPLYLQNLMRFQSSGLEILGRNYGYVSFRVADPFDFRELSFYTRWIRSFQDESNLTQLEIEKAFYDNILLFSNLNLATGDYDSEFRLTNSWQFLLGVKWGL